MIAPGPIVVAEASREEWDHLVAAMPYRTVYHSLGWLSAVESVFGPRLRMVKALRGDHCVGIWPWLEVRKGPLRVIGSPLPGWATAYLGPLLVDRSYGTEALAAMIRSPFLGRPAFMMCRTVDHGGEVDLTPYGFALSGRFETCLIDLRRDPDAIWGGLKSECRTRIRKAQKSGVTVHVESDDSYIDDHWRITEGVFARSHIRPPFPREFLVEVHCRLFPERLCAMSAIYQGRRIAMLLIPHDDRTAMYWAGGGLDEFLSLCPNNLIHWEALQECRRRGVGMYDFISSKGGPGRFKKTFGPDTVVSATHWEHSGSWVVSVLRRVYERRIRSRRRIG